MADLPHARLELNLSDEWLHWASPTPVEPLEDVIVQARVDADAGRRLLGETDVALALKVADLENDAPELDGAVRSGLWLPRAEGGRVRGTLQVYSFGLRRKDTKPGSWLRDQRRPARTPGMTTLRHDVRQGEHRLGAVIRQRLSVREDWTGALTHTLRVTLLPTTQDSVHILTARTTSELDPLERAFQEVLDGLTLVDGH